MSQGMQSSGEGGRRWSLRSPIGRADLVRLAEAFGGTLPPDAMEALGLHGLPGDKPPDPDLPRTPSGADQEEPGQGVMPLPMPSEPSPKVTPGERRLSFVRAAASQSLKEPEAEVRLPDPVRREEIKINWAARAPSAPPLMPWSRLAPGLRSRLGSVVAIRRLDRRGLERLASRGLPIAGLPWLSRVLWRHDMVVLKDASREMHPFQLDVRHLVGCLMRERGKAGLRTHEIRDVSELRELRRIPPSSAVLVLSAMGQLAGSKEIMREWVEEGRRWAAEGRVRLVLNPSPRDRWDPDVVGMWPTAWWDRGSRLPRGGRLPPMRGALSDDEKSAASRAVERLLELLAPSVRIEPSLLRGARLLLGADANAGTEHDAWNAPGTWPGEDCFGLEAGEAHERRHANRARDPMAGEAGRLVSQHHKHCSLALQVEVEIQVALSGGDEADVQQRLEPLLRRFVDHLEALASDSHGTSSVWGVPEWFESMVGRLPAALRAHPSIQQLLSRAWALSMAVLRPDWGDGDDSSLVAIPNGLDHEVVHQSLRRAFPGSSPRPWQVVMEGMEWRMEPIPALPRVRARGVPMAVIRAGSPMLTVAAKPTLAGESQPNHAGSFALPRDQSGMDLGKLGARSPVLMQSDRQALQFEPMMRPRWARSMAHDRHGLRATFEVGGVEFAMRWIPPGSFWMGSPKGEPGRDEDEGPRHWVTLTKGFWMGETPVTQEQWRAVVVASTPSSGRSPSFLERMASVLGRTSSQQAGKTLNPEPSHFRPREDLPRPAPWSAMGGLPVESVSWDDCNEFMGLLNKQVSLGGAPDGLSFRLPTEAEWEHACRAGTDTALYTGAIDLDGTSAKALDDIAWYVHNSGPDVDVENPRNPKGWMQEEFPIDRAGTHRVGMKRPNAWGLHDMLGNVWEWCADGKRDYRDEAETDPTGVTGEGDASRVVRGGSWDFRAWWCRSAYRYGWPRDSRRLNLGLRLLAGHQFGQEQDQQAGMVGGRAAPSPGPRGSGDARGAGPAGGRTGGGSSTGAKRGGNA